MALFELSVIKLLPSEVPFGASSGQKIPVRRIIMKIDKIQFIFVLMVPFLFVLLHRRECELIPRVYSPKLFISALSPYHFFWRARIKAFSTPEISH